MTASLRKNAGRALSVGFDGAASYASRGARISNLGPHAGVLSADPNTSSDGLAVPTSQAREADFSCIQPTARLVADLPRLDHRGDAHCIPHAVVWRRRAQFSAKREG